MAYAFERSMSHPEWAQVTGQAMAPERALGAVGAMEPAARPGVSTLMYVGHDGLGLSLGPDINATVRTVGWGAVALWAYAKFVKKDADLERKALYVAGAGFVASFIL